MTPTETYMKISRHLEKVRECKSKIDRIAFQNKLIRINNKYKEFLSRLQNEITGEDELKKEINYRLCKCVAYILELVKVDSLFLAKYAAMSVLSYVSIYDTRIRSMTLEFEIQAALPTNDEKLNESLNNLIKYIE